MTTPDFTEARKILGEIAKITAARDAAIAEIVALGREIILPYFRENRLQFRHNDGDWFICDARGKVVMDADLPEHVSTVLMMELGEGSRDYLGDHLQNITSADWTS